MVKLGEIFNRRSGIFRFKSVDDYQFDFHTLGKHTFYINTGVAACRYTGGIFGKACQIRGQFDENTVAFNGTYNSRYGFTRSEFIGVLLPCAEQFFV